MSNIVTLKDIVVEFDGERILDKINLDIKDKEFVTLLGPSGCGKTTTLRIIGGFISPDSGTLLFDGKKSTVFRLIKETLILFFSVMLSFRILMFMIILLSVCVCRNSPKRKFQSVLPKC